MHDKGYKAMFAGSALVGERGQVVIPAEVRRALGLNPGDRLVVLMPPGHEAVMLAKVEAIQAAIDALMGGLVASATEGEEAEDDAKSAQ